MRESSDRAQDFLNTINTRFGRFDNDNAVEDMETGFEGDFRTVGDFDIGNIRETSHQDDIQEVARNVDADIMDDVYSTVRNNSDGRHAGHNELRVLKAVEKEIPPGLITGADQRTIDQWYEDFRDAGLTYQEEDGEALTTEGEFFVEEAYRFMDKIGDGEDDERAEEVLGNLYSSLSRKYEDQGEKLQGFLLMAETDISIPDIPDRIDTTRRTAYNWANEWLESEENRDLALMRGEPSDRELTDLGRAAYNMLGNQYQRMDIASQMKAEMIERLDEQLPEEGTSPYVPGNNDMVAQYTDPDLVETYMTRE
jgi:hypothetical protein